MMLVDKLRDRAIQGAKSIEKIIQMTADPIIKDIISACEAKSDMGKCYYSFVFTCLENMGVEISNRIFQYIVDYFTDEGLTVTTETISNFDSPESKSKFVMNLQW